MRNIMFYIRSLDVKPHIDEHGTAHICISNWKAMDALDRHDAAGGKMSKFAATTLGKRLKGMSSDGWRNLSDTIPEAKESAAMAKKAPKKPVEYFASASMASEIYQELDEIRRNYDDYPTNGTMQQDHG